MKWKIYKNNLHKKQPKGKSEKIFDSTSSKFNSNRLI